MIILKYGNSKKLESAKRWKCKCDKCGCKVIRILYYSNGSNCQAMFKRNPDSTYKEGYEYRDGRGNVLERTKLEGQYTIDEVFDRCNRLCENYEVHKITID